MVYQVAQPEAALTWTAILNVANTALVFIVGFLLKEFWRIMHNRIDNIEEQQGNMRERVAALESGGTPRRRISDRR